MQDYLIWNWVTNSCKNEKKFMFIKKISLNIFQWFTYLYAQYIIFLDYK